MRGGRGYIHTSPHRIFTSMRPAKLWIVAHATLDITPLLNPLKCGMPTHFLGRVAPSMTFCQKSSCTGQRLAAAVGLSRASITDILSHRRVRVSDPAMPRTHRTSAATEKTRLSSGYFPAGQRVVCAPRLQRFCMQHTVAYRMVR